MFASMMLSLDDRRTDLGLVIVRMLLLLSVAGYARPDFRVDSSREGLVLSPNRLGSIAGRL